MSERECEKQRENGNFCCGNETNSLSFYSAKALIRNPRTQRTKKAQTSHGKVNEKGKSAQATS